jgi:hypothetical protein
MWPMPVRGECPAATPMTGMGRERSTKGQVGTSASSRRPLQTRHSASRQILPSPSTQRSHAPTQCAPSEAITRPYTTSIDTGSSTTSRPQTSAPEAEPTPNRTCQHTCRTGNPTPHGRNNHILRRRPTLPLATSRLRHRNPDRRAKRPPRPGRKRLPKRPARAVPRKLHPQHHGHRSPLHAGRTHRRNRHGHQTDVGRAPPHYRHRRDNTHAGTLQRRATHHAGGRGPRLPRPHCARGRHVPRQKITAEIPPRFQGREPSPAEPGPASDPSSEAPNQNP